MIKAKGDSFTGPLCARILFGCCSGLKRNLRLFYFYWIDKESLSTPGCGSARKAVIFFPLHTQLKPTPQPLVTKLVTSPVKFVWLFLCCFGFLIFLVVSFFLSSTLKPQSRLLKCLSSLSNNFTRQRLQDWMDRHCALHFPAASSARSRRPRVVSWEYLMNINSFEM